MAIINFTGFELGDEGGLSGVGGDWSIQSTVTRSGGFAFRVATSVNWMNGYCDIGGITGGGRSTTFGLPNIYARFYFRWHVKPTSLDDQIAAIRETTGDKLAVVLDAEGTLSVWRNATKLGTTTQVLDQDTWYCIEIRCGTGGAAAWGLRIDESLVLSGTADLGTNNAIYLRLGKGTNYNNNDVDLYYDDVTIENGNYPGAGAVVARVPVDSPTWAQFTEGTGTPYYDQIDTIPADGVSFIENPTGNGAKIHHFTFQSASSAGISGTPRASKILAWVREKVSAASSVQIRHTDNVSTVSTTALDLTGTSWECLNQVRSVHPSAAAWTLSNLENFEAGLKENNAVAIQCCALIQEVEFKPAVALAGTITASSSLTATIGGPISLSGAAAAVSSVSGALLRSVGLAGPIDAISAATASARLAIPLGGGAVGSASSVSTSPLRAARSLSGSLGASSSVGGVLTRSYGVSGSIGATASTSGALRLAAALAGSLSAEASTFGNLTLGADVILSGVLASISSIGTSPLRLSLALGGSTGATAEISGALQRSVTLGGAVGAASSVELLLDLVRELQGQAGAVSDIAAADLLLAVSLSGQVSSASSVEILLGSIEELSGALGSSSSLSAEIQVPKALAGGLGAVGGVNALVGVRRPLAGALVAQAIVSGSLYSESDHRIGAKYVFRPTKRQFTFRAGG